MVEFSFKYVPKESVPKTYDVDCYFPVHQGCKMTLYQVGTTILPRILIPMNASLVN